MTTWIDVADTAVKIGLSGIVGAVGAYVISKANHGHELTRQRITRRIELLEKASVEFQGFLQSIDEIVSVAAKVRSGDSYHDVRDALMEPIRTANHKLNSAAGLAGLLNEAEIATTLEAVGKAFTSLYQYLIDHPLDANADTLDEVTKPIYTLSGEFIPLMADAYARVDRPKNRR